MTRSVRSLWLLPVAACLALACGCEEDPWVAESDPADAAPEPWPPPYEGELDEYLEDEPGEETPYEEYSEPEEESEYEVPDPAPDAPLTPEQARSAIEDLGGRVALDESGNVVKVFLNRTQIDDEQIRVVQFLPDIEVLNLTGTPITDTALEHLRTLKKLRHLYPAKTDVTDHALEELQQVLPDCKVYR